MGLNTLSLADIAQPYADAVNAYCQTLSDIEKNTAQFVEMQKKQRKNKYFPAIATEDIKRGDVVKYDPQTNQVSVLTNE